METEVVVVDPAISATFAAAGANSSSLLKTLQAKERELNRREREQNRERWINIIYMKRGFDKIKDKEIQKVVRPLENVLQELTTSTDEFLNVAVSEDLRDALFYYRKCCFEQKLDIAKYMQRNTDILLLEKSTRERKVDALVYLIRDCTRYINYYAALDECCQHFNKQKVMQVSEYLTNPEIDENKLFLMMKQSDEMFAVPCV